MNAVSSIDIKSLALKTIQQEADAINALRSMIDDQFEKAVQAIQHTKGRLVISGIGKSAIIAQKIVATLNSTGTPAIFLHAADAIHGDLGMVQQQDVVMVISKSGESPEIKVLIPLIRNFGNTIIGMVGNMHSFLAKNSNIVLNTTVSQEACPNNLAPTSSTTAQLVMGDAMAVVLMELKGFGSDDFARFHPGGTLGKKLYLRVADLYTQNEKPAVLANATLKEVIVEISRKRLGVTAVTNDQQQLLGIITDGDLRRMLEKSVTLDSVTASEIMTVHPKTIAPDALAIEALDLLRQYDITQLVVSSENQYLGIIHLHDLVREGLI
ncbi:KpsF/GutQ family sugar-phosphate isomerase [Pseudobacter ginsenosidimutans]|uniref:Arabinose-5-phosphate isomerase n=1 Tax=Pseudobacter ginsenosidimutans TaxID=661488 RepID=A0A4Q7MSK0_9BACT|nr:KpsF/GutQ family sugar-phosphate isomerase [Pseudobacter ginsenosidimutans]QEC41427.1 KpsF/GutQ family sugar-phosphate isomerase [Pseudobacter ginsenosidimutans]RZS71792.1 arabinose-5-phosphate isomerase [Pseudobacter ginsenosidimutans]